MRTITLYDINGNDLSTTFIGDFDIANRFGKRAVVDTFNRAFKAWKHDINYLTALAVALNHQCWETFENPKYSALSELYQDYGHKISNYVYADNPENFNEKERNYFFEITD